MPLLYTYSTAHLPIELNCPLWMLRTERPLEWQEMIRTLEESPRELLQVFVSVPDVKSCLPHNFYQTGKHLYFKINKE